MLARRRISGRLLFGEWVPGQFTAGAVLSVPCALITVWCTGMIYASLPTIRAWNQPLVAPVYVVLALATGGVLTNLLLAVSGYELRWAAIGTFTPQSYCWSRCAFASVKRGRMT